MMKVEKKICGKKKSNVEYKVVKNAFLTRHGKYKINSNRKNGS
jgi:hypothetical protein